MDQRVEPLTELLRLNTLLFRNCLIGMSDEMSRRRPTPTTNHAAFVAAHVADSRYFLLKILGAPQPSPLEAYIGSAGRLDEVQKWPTLEETHAAWTKAGHALRDRLVAMKAAELDAPCDPPFLGEGVSRLSGLSFLSQHESYHIGQLSLLRTYVGLPAMKYP
ncbi:MAG TPA: DinB family protein [Gemmatimonadaceae bacterium]|nr:DinB family protein [Gemmatimonadaceae bacterium]